MKTAEMEKKVILIYFTTWEWESSRVMLVICIVCDGRSSTEGE